MRHDKVHNLFGYNMTRAAGEAFERLEPDKRILMTPSTIISAATSAKSSRTTGNAMEAAFRITAAIMTSSTQAVPGISSYTWAITLSRTA